MESSLLSGFEWELGIAFEALQEKRASSRADLGILWFVSSCGGRLGIPLQVPPGDQGASRVASGKSNLYSSCEGECGSGLVSWQGNQASIRMEEGLSRCFWGPRLGSSRDPGRLSRAVSAVM